MVWVDASAVVTAGVALKATAAGISFTSLVPTVKEELDPIALTVDAHGGNSAIRLTCPRHAICALTGNDTERASHARHYFCDQGLSGPWNSDSIAIF